MRPHFTSFFVARHNFSAVRDFPRRIAQFVAVAAKGTALRLAHITNQGLRADGEFVGRLVADVMQIAAHCAALLLFPVATIARAARH